MRKSLKLFNELTRRPRYKDLTMLPRTHPDRSTVLRTFYIFAQNNREKWSIVGSTIKRLRRMIRETGQNRSLKSGFFFLRNASVPLERNIFPAR